MQTKRTKHNNKNKGISKNLVLLYKANNKQQSKKLKLGSKGHRTLMVPV